MLKWGYNIFDTTQVTSAGREGLEELLNSLGDEGWEVVAANVDHVWGNFNIMGVAKSEKQDD